MIPCQRLPIANLAAGTLYRRIRATAISGRPCLAPIRATVRSCAPHRQLHSMHHGYRRQRGDAAALARKRGRPEPAPVEEESEEVVEDEDEGDVGLGGEDVDEDEDEGDAAGDEDGDEDMDEADMLDAYFGIPSMVSFNRGENGLIRVFLKHPYSESAAEIYLHGATVTQWLRPSGEDCLALRPDSDFGGVNAIESGVKLCFPQYREGSLPEDGFVNKLEWEVVAAGLDFLPISDGFRLRHLDESTVDEALRDAEADRLKGGGSQGEEASSDLEGRPAGEPSGGADGRQEVDPFDAVPISSPFVAKGGGTRDILGELLAGDPIPGSSAAPDPAEDPDEGDPDLMDSVAPYTKLDAATRLVKKYMDSGSDPAPYVTLRLRDSDATREMGWPHKFELLYKITLMEEDGFEDPIPGPESENLSLETSLPRMVKAMEDKEQRVDEVLATGLPSEQDPELAEIGVRQGPELHPSLINPDEDDHGSADPLDDKLRMEAAEEDEDFEDVPMQLRLELRLINEDPEGSAPMVFQVAKLIHFATKDIMTDGDFIKVRGLGGSNTIDYSEDERRPALGFCDEDYIRFMGQRIDATFINAAKADVTLCPGDATHYELLPREGYKDMMLFHPGLLRDMSREDTTVARNWVALGCGRVSIPQRLEAGEEWVGELVIRFHNRNMQDPVWGDNDEMRPISDIPRSQLEEDGNQIGGPDEENYGGIGGL